MSKTYLKNSAFKKICLSIALFAGTSTMPSLVEGGILSNAPAYDWWYGCAPTSVGMMMGYYDINGYGGLRYDNLVPGGVAELNTFGNSGALANQIIASSGHISDFYGGGYSASGDDVAPPYHSFNSLADFMGTSQDSVGNSNGSTTFYNYTDGSRFTCNDAVSLGITEKSGMYGIYEYVTYTGYEVNTLYNQYTDNQKSAGFSLTDFQNEIDNNRTVVLHVEGHSMFGYGYDGDTIYFHDTWDANPHTMTWGTSYSGMPLYAVTVMELTGGSPVPEPGTFILLSTGLLGLALIKKRRTGHV